MKNGKSTSRSELYEVQSNAESESPRMTSGKQIKSTSTFKILKDDENNLANYSLQIIPINIMGIQSLCIDSFFFHIYTKPSLKVTMTLYKLGCTVSQYRKYTQTNVRIHFINNKLTNIYTIAIILQK